MLKNIAKVLLVVLLVAALFGGFDTVTEENPVPDIGVVTSVSAQEGGGDPGEGGNNNGLCEDGEPGC